MPAAPPVNAAQAKVSSVRRPPPPPTRWAGSSPPHAGSRGVGGRAPTARARVERAWRRVHGGSGWVGGCGSTATPVTRREVVRRKTYKDALVYAALCCQLRAPEPPLKGCGGGFCGKVQESAVLRSAEK